MSRDLRDDARALILAALRAADPARCVARALAESPTVAEWGGAVAEDAAGPAASPLDQRGSGDTLVVAIGEAAGAMAAGAFAVLGEHISAGVVALPDGARLPELPSCFRVQRTSEDLLDLRSVAAAVDIRTLVEGAGAGDRVLVLLSPGADACVSDPEAGLDVHAIRDVVAALRTAGWSDTRVGPVRGVVDRFMGGGLARLCWPAMTVGVVMAEGPARGELPSEAASLATASATARDVEIQIRRAGIWGTIPSSVQAVIDTRRTEELQHAPPVEIIRADLDEGIARALRREAERRSYTVQSLGESLGGEAEVLGRALGRAVGAAQDGAAPMPLPACLIGASEASVRDEPGRNQSIALAAARALDGRDAVALTAIALNGVDGSADAAGAIVDGRTAARARDLSVRLTSAEDAGTVLKLLGDRLVTGPTGAWPRDLYLALIAAPATD